MRLIQLPVYPPPPGVSFKGKTALVTGATDGIGRETARQLLVDEVSILVFGIRDLTKGENVRQELLADPEIKEKNPDAVIKLMQVDLGSLQNVKAFTAAVGKDVPRLDLLILNAGMGAGEFKQTVDGNEMLLQVNYLSNALILVGLLPLLEATSKKTRSPSRAVWLGSRRHISGNSLASSKHMDPESSVFDHFNDKANFFSIMRYGDSKLLCVMFMYELAKRVKKEEVIINQLCPGMIWTGIGNYLILPLRILFHIAHYLRARSAEQAGWLVINAAGVAGAESHGQFLLDTEIEPRYDFIESAEGQEIQKKLWTETMATFKEIGLEPKFS